MLTLRFGDRILAVMGRDIFREWLIHQQAPFEIDDVVWFTEADLTCLTIDGQVTYAVPSVAVGVPSWSGLTTCADVLSYSLSLKGNTPCLTRLPT